MPKRTKSHKDSLTERLQDPDYALAYLEAALNDDDEGSDATFLLAMQDVARARRID